MANLQKLSQCSSKPVQLAKGCAQKPLLLHYARAARVAPSRHFHGRHTVTHAVQNDKTETSEASSGQEQKPEIAKFADSIGLPTEEGLFGFKPFPEVWVGRLAMAGFVSSVLQEFRTGKGTLQQLGLLTPNPVLLVVIIAAATGASVFGFARTLSRARGGNMSPTELKRYGKFLGISNEASAISETETEMKKNWKGDPAPPEALTGSGSQNPTDTFQSKQAESGNNNQPFNDVVSTPSEERQFQDAGQRYARNVEVTNGRAAMIGFLVTTALEAWTGKGILSQMLWELKLVNILGPASGF